MVLFSTQAGKINKILPPTHALLPKIPIFQEKEISSSNVKKLLYLSKENFSYIPGNGTLHFSTQAWKKKKKKKKKKNPKKIYYTYGNRNLKKIYYIFSKESCSHISENRSSEKIIYISGNGALIQRLHERHVDDTYVRRKQNETDWLHHALNSYHQKRKLTLELNSPCSLIKRLFEETAKLQLKCTIKSKSSL